MSTKASPDDVTCLSRTTTRGTAGVLRSIFDYFDQDKNGKIDQNEMTELVKSIYELQLACSHDPWYQADRYATRCLACFSPQHIAIVY